MSIREVVEGTQEQGVDESIAYTLDTTAAGGTPSSVSVAVKLWPAGTDVKSTVMPSGSPSVNGNVITLPALGSLTAENTYRVEVKYTTGGNVLEDYILIRATV